MTRLTIPIAILAASLLLATSARAAPDQPLSDENVADVRCVVVAFSLMESTDPQLKALATGAGLYYVGRLKGRAPDLDLEAAILKQVGTMAPEDVRDELQRCGRELRTEGNDLKAMGEDLKKHGADAAAAQAPK